MSHQDWNPIVFKKTVNKNNPTNTEPRKPTPDRKLYKIEQQDEDFTHEKVSQNLSLAIQQGRTSKGWTRKELARRLNVKEGVIEEYETRKAIPNGVLIQRIGKILDIKLSKNM